MCQIFDFLIPCSIPNIKLQLLAPIVVTCQLDHLSKVLHRVCHLLSTTLLRLVVHEGANQGRLSNRTVPHHDYLRLLYCVICWITLLTTLGKIKICVACWSRTVRSVRGFFASTTPTFLLLPWRCLYHFYVFCQMIFN